MAERGERITLLAGPRALSDAERALVLGLARRNLGLSPSVVLAQASDIASLEDARDLLERAHAAGLLGQTRVPGRVDGNPNSAHLREAVWIGKDRRFEWADLGLEDASTRLRYAVQVAEVAAAVGGVRTADVTAVFRCLPELRPAGVALTNTLLTDAVARGLMASSTDDAKGRRRRWRSLGAPPAGRAFARWVDVVRPLFRAQLLDGSGTRDYVEVLALLVAGAIQHATDAKTWPFGRPVSTREVQRAIDAAPALQALAQTLPTTPPLAKQLAEATRIRQGLTRDRATLIAVEAPAGRAALYDLRTSVGGAARETYRVYVDLEAQTTPAVLDAWRAELDAAARLREGPDVTIATAAVAAVRLVHAAQHLATLSTRLHALGGSVVLGPTTRDTVQEWIAEVSALESRCTNAPQWTTDAEARLATIGAPSLARVQQQSGAWMLPDEIKALACEPAQEGRSASQWLRLFHFPQRRNPHFQGKRAAEADARAQYLFDRPSAISALAERRARHSASVYGAAAQLVGSGPRSVALFHAAWRHATHDEAPSVLLALALVDGARAAAVARTVLTDERAPAATRAAALLALCLDGQFDHDADARCASDDRPEVQATLDACRLAVSRNVRLP